MNCPLITTYLILRVKRKVSEFLIAGDKENLTILLERYLEIWILSLFRIILLQIKLALNVSLLQQNAKALKLQWKQQVVGYLSNLVPSNLGSKSILLSVAETWVAIHTERFCEVTVKCVTVKQNWLHKAK